MTKQFILPLLCLLFASASATDSQQGKQKCTSTPCANTATGEDPGEIELRDANAELNKIRASSDDKLRWQTITLFSNSNDAKNQTLMVHKEGRTQLTLEADKGLLVFRTPQRTHAFKIAPPLGTDDNPCPKYQIEVVDASAQHAIVRKICPKFKTSQGREFKSFDYYLYDVATATMRSIWSAAAVENVSLLKSPTPDPVVTPTSKGYRYQWKGNVALGGSIGMVSYDNIYERQRSKEGVLELVCTDLSVGKKGKTEGGTCEGGILTPTNPITSK